MNSIKNSIKNNRENNNFQCSPVNSQNVNFEDHLKYQIVVEILHNIGLISNKLYYDKYNSNAENLDRDFEIWNKFKEI